MKDQQLLIATPEFFTKNLNSNEGLIRILRILNEVYYSYMEHRVNRTGVVNEQIEIHYVTGVKRDLIDIVETLFNEDGAPSVFAVERSADIFLRGPETLGEVLNIIDDLFDFYIRSGYFECPQPEFLMDFCGLRRALNALVSNIYTALICPGLKNAPQASISSAT